MNGNFEKTKELLAGAKGPTATALKAFAMDIDNKFAELEKKNDERHTDIMKALSANKAETDKKITQLETNTNEKFSKLKVVMFFSEHSYLFWIIVIAILIVAGVKSDISSFVKLLK